MYNSLPSSKFVRLATIAATGAFLAGGVLSYVHAHGGHLAKEELSKRLAKEQAEADADAEVDSGQRTNNVYYLNSCRWERYGGTLNGGSFYQCPSTKVPVSVSYTTQDYWEHYVGAVHSGIGWKEGSDQDYQGSFISGGPGDRTVPKYTATRSPPTARPIAPINSTSPHGHEADRIMLRTRECTTDRWPEGDMPPTAK